MTENTTTPTNPPTPATPNTPLHPPNDHHATNAAAHVPRSPDHLPGTPQAISGPRRLTIHIPGDHAEACQFTNGVIMAYWCDPPQPYIWRDLGALREQWPDAELTWIDREVTSHQAAGPVKRFRLREPIEAVRWVGGNAAELAEFCGNSFFLAVDPADRGDDPDATAAVVNRYSAWSPLTDGQWVVRDRAGGFYALDHDDLAADYDAVPDAEPARTSVFVAEVIWFDNDPVDGRDRVAVCSTLEGALGVLCGHKVHGGDLVATEVTGSALGTDAARTWAVHERGEEPDDEGHLWITEEQLLQRTEAQDD